MKSSFRSRIRERFAAEKETDRQFEVTEPDRAVESPPSRRSERETSRLLSILDELSAGEETP
jgi:hypothetical protein